MYMVRVTIIVIIMGSICVVLFTTLVNRMNQPSEDIAMKDAPATHVQVKPIPIVDKPLPETSSRATSEPYTHVMIHFASDALANPENPHNVQAVYDVFAKARVGAHYYIARDGTAYRFIPETRKAHHAGPGQLAGFTEVSNNMNGYSIGIELAAVGSAEEMKKFFGMDAATYARIPEADRGYTAQQYATLALLLDEITRRYDIPFDRRHIVGHDEYAPQQKTDPGTLFDWGRIGL